MSEALDTPWTDAASMALMGAFDGAFVGAFSTEDVPVVAAAVDHDGASIHERDSTAASRRFALASLTKPITGTLLATLVTDETVRLDQPIGTWLDAGDNAERTLGQLASHTAGLPRLAPDRWSPPSDPYRHLQPPAAEEALRAVQCQPGGFRYSNFGYQLLGLCLERAAGLPFADLLASRVLQPLDMSTGAIHADPSSPESRWAQPLPAAGGALGTIRDLAAFVRAYLEPPDDSWQETVALAATPIAEVGGHGYALGWRVMAGGLLAHTGEAPETSAALAVDPVGGRGVAVLAGTGGATDALDLAATLTLRGKDPADARPRPLDPRWEDRAHRVLDALLERSFPEVHRLFTDAARALLPADKIDLLWSMRTAGAGKLVERHVSCRPLGRYVAADATVVFERRPLPVAMVFDEDGGLADLRFLRSTEAPPW